MGTFFPQICCFQYSGARRICKYILTIYFNFIENVLTNPVLSPML